MPNFSGIIDGFVAGDDLEIVRTITGLPIGITITDAWFTVKASITDADTNALVQKHITSVASASGIISDTGTDGIAEVRFFILPTESDQLGGPVQPTSGFVYDIQIKTSSSRVYTPEKGKITAETQVTRLIT